MSDNLHIIITGDEGKARSLLFSKRKLRQIGLIAVSISAVLIGISYNTLYLSDSNPQLKQQIVTLNTQLDEDKQKNKQMDKLSKQLQESTLEQDTLAQEITNLKKLNSSLVKDFQEEKNTILNTAVSELEERSDILERIIGNIGLKINDIPKDNSNSGGPFIAPPQSIGRELLFRSEYYLNTIKSLPLGRPIPGLVTSRFGHRTDPVNGKKGFHTGVDMRGPNGQKILATADGVVTKAFFNGSYGRYIEIRHGNGYTTKFAHMKKFLVKRGDKITRGEAIGTVGNSGRSTGTHLHYEVCLHNKPINPSKYMRVDKLVKRPPIPHLRAKSQRKIKHQVIAKNQTPATIVQGY